MTDSERLNELKKEIDTYIEKYDELKKDFQDTFDDYSNVSKGFYVACEELVKNRVGNDYQFLSQKSREELIKNEERRILNEL